MVREAAPAAAVEVEADAEEEALAALGTAATVFARAKARLPSEVILLGGGILVHGDEAGGDETLGELAALDMAASKLGPSTGGMPSLLPSFSGDMGSKK
jgi:hypothetical protein